MRATVHVFLKPGVLDVQGKAVEQALHGLGWAGVEHVRVGRTIEFDLAAKDAAAAEAEVKAMCDKLLAHTVIESYRASFRTLHGREAPPLVISDFIICADTEAKVAERTDRYFGRMFATVAGPAENWVSGLREHGVWALAPGENVLRLVFHADIDDVKLDRAINAFRKVADSLRPTLAG